LVDRYDLVFVFESLKDREEKTNYAKKKLTILKRNGEISEDYTFLRKLIEHAKTFTPQLSEEAEAMIIDWSDHRCVLGSLPYRRLTNCYKKKTKRGE
jgi:DNA replicative helicase MCM subunit Mcm2 (Cdc46/Mcm family)